MTLDRITVTLKLLSLNLFRNGLEGIRGERIGVEGSGKVVS